MRSIDTTKLDRKPEEAEGPAVRLSPMQLLGAPFKPVFALSGIPQHLTRLFVIRSEAEGSAVLLPYPRPPGSVFRSGSQIGGPQPTLAWMEDPGPAWPCT
jgi:hypothetical protein